MSDASNQESTQKPGLKMAKLLTLPSEQRQLLQWLMKRQGCYLADVMAWLERDEMTTRQLLAPLLEKGWLQETISEGVRFYRVRLAPTGGKKKNATQLLQKLQNNTSSPDGDISP